MKFLLVEDNQELANAICARMAQDGHVVDHAANLEDASAFVDTQEYDLILLDINLGDGTGFEVLEQCADKAFHVIFTTAYDEYAIKAFKYSALDYLLKPINPQEFIHSVNRVKERQEGIRKEQLQYASGIAESGVGNRIVVNSSSEIHFIDLDEILRLESYSNYTDIYLLNGQKITSTKTLKFYENLLAEANFFRIHQKHLVHLKYIKKYLKEDGGYVLLSDASKLEVSRRKKEDLLNKLLN